MTQDTDQRKGGSFSCVRLRRNPDFRASSAGTIETLFHICARVRAICLSNLSSDIHSRFQHEYVMLLLWLAKHDHHVAFLGLVEFQVFKQHLAKFASYCQDLASAGSALARLKVMVSRRLFASGKSKKSDCLVPLFRRHTWTPTATWQK